MNSPRPRNQRVTKPRHRRQQHLLEVSVRRDVARVQRQRVVFGFVCKTLLLVGLCAGLYIGGKEALRRFLWENPDYFLSDLRVDTDGALTREQILSTANVEEGRNIFKIDLAAARNALNHLPQVERVELQRVLPNRLNINITEHRPVAWVTQRGEEDPTSSDKAFLIDARSVVMRSKVVLPEYLHLPVVSGVEVENVAPGQKMRSLEMQVALDLIRLNGDNARFQPRNLDIAKGYCVVVTDQLHRKVTFGLDRVDQQLERFLRYLDYLEPSGRELRTVNLLVERNTPVTFFEPPAVEPIIEVLPLPAKSDAAKEKIAASREPKEKATPAVKKAEAVSTPAPLPDTKPARESTPSNRKRTPIDSIKKPFRLHG